MLEVSDNGRGIPQKDLDRITEPFYMGDPSRSKANGGFGLGLALVREIASVHGGALELDSTVGEGTTVRIVLPEPQRESNGKRAVNSFDLAYGILEPSQRKRKDVLQ